MALCEIKLSEESDLVTVSGIPNRSDELSKFCSQLKEHGFEPWTVCRCEVFRLSSSVTLLLPSGRLGELLEIVREAKKTTPKLITMIRTGVQKVEIICSDSVGLLSRLLSVPEFEKPELICVGDGKVELVFETHAVPSVIGIASDML